MYYELTDKFVVSSPLDKTWEFFSSAKNLSTITPDWLDFKITGNLPKTMKKDVRLNYTIRWMGIPIRWRTLITQWNPPYSFSDMQLKGPYSLWLHEHRFTKASENTTECSDRVIYEVPGFLVGSLMNELMIKRQLTEIFLYRRKMIREYLGWKKSLQPDIRIRKLR